MKAQLINITLGSKRTIQIKKIDQPYLDGPFHFHQLCELVWIEEGFGKRIIGDRVENFSDGDLVLMSPNLPHIWLNDAVFQLHIGKYRSKATVVYFPSDFVLNLSDEPGIIQPIEDLIRRAARGLRFYGKTQQKVTRILSGISPRNGLKKIMAFLNVIDILSDSKEYEYIAGISYKNTHDEKDIRSFNEVYQFLMQHFQGNITLKQVAGICCMSQTTFCRFFKSRTGKTFVEFLNEIRVSHACKVLQDENHSISDACYESGFNNLTNFNKRFKLICHKTPSTYRRDLKKTIEAL